MSAAAVHIHLTCVYARKDAFILNQLSSHLERLRLEEVIDRLEYMEVDSGPFLERNYPKEAREADMFVLLISPHLLASPFIRSAFLSHLLAAHRHGQIKIVPISIAECDLTGTPLVRLQTLENNRIPIKNEHDRSLEATLADIAGELQSVINEWRGYKQELEDRWQEAQSSDEIIYYLNFLDDYPYSIYREAAAKRRDELIEEKLWNEAKAFDQVFYYYTYLRDAPLQLYRVEAIERITDIEHDESIALEDAMQSDSLALLFDYKVRFPYGEDMGKVETRIGDLIETRINHIDEPEYIKTEAYYLQHLAYERLNAEELLSMRLLLNYTQSLLRRSRGVSASISSTQMSLILVGGFALLVGIYSLIPLYYYALDQVVGLRPFSTFAICVVAFYAAYRAFLGHRIAKKDREFCAVTSSALERSLVTIKIAAIDHDKQATLQEILSLNRIEAVYTRLNNNNNFWSYMFDRSVRGSRRQEEVVQRLPLPLKGGQ